MFELHAWITIRETYQATDEENLDKIVSKLKH